MKQIATDLNQLSHFEPPKALWEFAQSFGGDFQKLWNNLHEPRWMLWLLGVYGLLDFRTGLRLSFEAIKPALKAFKEAKFADLRVTRAVKAVQQWKDKGAKLPNVAYFTYGENALDIYKNQSYPPNIEGRVAQAVAYLCFSAARPQNYKDVIEVFEITEMITLSLKTRDEQVKLIRNNFKQPFSK